MSDGAEELVGFAYGEEVEGVPPRSRGYRLLTPPAEPWGREVEVLARRLQLAPYPTHWPTADLFCSVLLEDGRRLVALARYGLSDHTPGARPGGVELVGVVAPGGLEVRSALAVYHWLRQRRAQAEDLGRLGGRFALADVIRSTPEVGVPPGGPVAVLPVRLWQDGVLLFAASTPTDPDRHLPLLEQGAGTGWQWLPLVGADFPLQEYARHGPVIAWTPYLAGLALRLERKPPEPTLPAASRRRSRWALGAALVLLIGLLGANLWSLLRIHERLGETAATAPAPPPAPAQPLLASPPAPAPPGPSADESSRDRFVAALAELIAEQGGMREWDGEQDQLLTVYQEAAVRHKDLRVGADDRKGKLAVAAVSVLAGRSAERIAQVVREGLSNKGFSQRLIDAACAHVREQFSADLHREAAHHQ